MMHQIRLDHLNNGQLRFLAEQLRSAGDKNGSLTVFFPANPNIPYVFHRSAGYADGNWTVNNGTAITEDQIEDWLNLEFLESVRDSSFESLK